MLKSLCNGYILTKVLCVIPAKGNSRRLKNKNKLILKGKPLVRHTVDAAVESGCFSKIIVSSNDDEILNLIETNEIVHKDLRPDYLCKDDTRAKDVVKYYLDSNIDYTHVALLMPTTPFRNAQDIKNAFEIVFKNQAKTLVSVCEYEFNPSLAIKIEGNKAKSYFNENIHWNKEDQYPKGFHLNGGIYIAEKDYFLKHETFFDNTSFVYEMPRIRSIDIDTKEDFELAEAILEIL